MARTVSGQKSGLKKTTSRKAAPKAKAKAVATKKQAATPARKSGLRKIATGRKAAAKKAVARVAVARRPVKRRARVTAAPARRKAARLKTAAATQRFSVSHLNESDFKADGLRSYALYRDLGIASASGGLCLAHVIRLLQPCTDEVRKRHIHKPELQLIYVLKGWIKNEFEGHDVQMMSAGSCWLQPPGIKHTVLDYSADVEMLEIIVPADFKTIDLD